MKNVLRSVAVVAAVLALMPGCKKKQEETSGNAAGNGKAQQEAQANNANGNSAGGEPAKKNPEGCNSDLKERIEANYTLTEKCSPYTVDHEFSVDGWDLTIEPGVTVKFTENGYLSVAWNHNSRLTAKGTPEKPIQFVSGGRSEAGAWRAVELYSHADGSVLENVVIENAGKDDKAALLVDGPKDVHLKNVKVVASKGKAFEVSNKAHVVEFDGNDFTQAGDHEVIGSMDFVSLDGIKTNKWPAKSVIEVDEDSCDHDMTVANAGIPYRILHDAEFEAPEGKTAVITVAAGTVFQMGEGTKWGFGWNRNAGAKFLGTAEAPIVFTRFGDNQDKGSWKGIEFYDHARPVQLDYVKIEYAGEKDGAAIKFSHLKSLGKLTHLNISKGLGAAVKADDKENTFEAFSDNTFDDVDSPTLVLHTEAANNLGANNTYPKDGAIALKGDVHQDTTLTAQGVAYQVLDKIDVEGQSEVKPVTLTIQPGASFKFGEQGGFGIGWNNPGTIVAVGAADKPITFSAAGDTWKGIDVNKGKAQVENAVFEKTADDEPAIKYSKGTSGDVKALKFNDVKIPVRDCTDKKIQTNDVKAVADGC